MAIFAGWGEEREKKEEGNGHQHHKKDSMRGAEGQLKEQWISTPTQRLHSPSSSSSSTCSCTVRILLLLVPAISSSSLFAYLALLALHLHGLDACLPWGDEVIEVPQLHPSARHSAAVVVDVLRVLCACCACRGKVRGNGQGGLRHHKNKTLGERSGNDEQPSRWRREGGREGRR